MTKPTKKLTSKGPKPGSARSNQHIKYAADDATGRKAAAPAAKPTDKITSVKATSSGDYIAVCNHTAGALDGDTITYRRNAETPELKKLAVVGASMRAVTEYLAKQKPEAKLANGVDSKSSVHARKAIDDAKRAKALAGKVAPAAKAPKAAKAKAPATGAEWEYKLGASKNEAREGTWRYHMLRMIQDHTSTADAKAAHAKSKQFPGSKLDFNWAARTGYIIRK